MSSKQGYGVPVNTDGVSSTLESTRRLRLALNVLWDEWDELPPDVNTEPVRETLQSIHDQINAIETDGLRLWGQAEHYLIIRPISPVSPPPPEIMEKITGAVRTLAELGMLAGQNDAGYRE
jgi:hypothetical protein